MEYDLNIVDELLHMEHPLKKAPLSYIYSELYLFFTSQKGKKSRITFLREQEDEVKAKDKEGRGLPDSF